MRNRTRTTQDLMSHHLLLTLFLFGMSSTIHSCNPVEHQSLLALPFLTYSPLLNWSSLDCCKWEGISCNHKSQVTHILLPYKGLKGSVSATLKNLTYLSYFNLSHNSLFGHLPKGLFSSLNHLKVLDLSYNNLHGDVGEISSWPDSIQVIDISSNHFYGIIPSSFFQRTWRLIKLNVSNNSFTGPIPSFSYTNSSFVKLLDFSSNNHYGSIPWGLGTCSKLKFFRASSNSLSGLLPHDIYNATGLEEISLSSNNLLGPISEDIVYLTKLTNLQLDYNKLSGELPRNIGKLSKLKYLLLDSNNLAGPLPLSLANCTNLMKLMLWDNFLEGDISTFNFSSLRQLTIIDLGSNNLFGNLPGSLYSCKSLVAIRLSSNKLEGQIVQEVIHLKFLSFLSLTSNRLINITGATRILMLCKSLSVLLLGENFLHEAMPSDDSIVSSNGFKNIQVLDFANCQLTGQLPNWLSLSKKLEVLHLGYNCIIGPIPDWLSTLPRLFHLDLSYNLISGDFLKVLCTMPALVSMEAPGENSYFSLPIFSDRINHWEYKSLSKVEPSILVSGNHFSGEIPIEIGQLKQLHVLDLSQNNFSGNIPYQIVGLINLEVLDLSSNQLLGEIPESIINLNFLSYFNVSFNHLHGQIPSGTQLQSFDASAYEGNLELCGPPLPKCAYIVNNNEDKHIPKEEDRLGMQWFLLCVVFGFIIGFWGVCGLLLLNCNWRLAYFQYLDTVGHRLRRFF